MIMNAAAFCAVGAEKAVSNELRKLELKVTENGFGRVRFKADVPGLYKALIGLRAADRVLLEAALFPASDFDALFEGTRSAAWEDYVPRGAGLVVAKVRTNRSVLRAETSIQAMVHKAAAERLCQKWGVLRLPDQGEKAELRVNIEKDNVTLLLDLSGAPLFKRGYRADGGAAPLRETTAAALILLSGWKRKFPLYDPFCGSGTIAAEAAMYAWDMAPGLNRNFALERLLISSRKAEKVVRDEFLDRIDFSRRVRIAGSDVDPKSARLAQTNIEKILSLYKSKNESRNQAHKTAGFGMINFRTIPVEEAAVPAWDDGNSNEPAAPDSGAGYIITNPPYGKRLGSPELSEEIYRSMGDLSQRFPGWKLVLVCDHPGFESFFGKKADSCREITNGAIQLYMYEYDKL